MNKREQFVNLVAKAIGVKQPIEQGTVDRVAGKSPPTAGAGEQPSKRVDIESTTEPLVTAPVRNTVSGVDSGRFMSPGQPILPQHPDVAGRQWDFPVGLNLQYQPRGTEAISFAQLRALADNYDLLRLLIETRKDQLVKFKWKIQPVEEADAEGGEGDERCKQIQAFLRFPDRKHNWQTWLRALVEDMLVTDAATIYPIVTRGGDLYSLELMDGTTLSPVIDYAGRIPDPPEPAFQQVIKGLPVVNYHWDEIIYAPRNVRVNRLYGYSPVEQLIMTVNIAMRRQLFTLQYYTEGNIPEALITVPDTWNPDQITAYQAYWDAMFEGNTAMRRHAKFIPGGQRYTPTKDEVLKDAFDEWLARICCYAFSLPPSPFVKDQNRATSESAKEAALEEGLVPLMSWIKDTLDLVIQRWWGFDDLEFQWQDDEPTDPVEVADVHDKYLRNGTICINEIRADLGKDSIKGGDIHMVYTGAGATPLDDVLNPPEPVLPPGMGGVGPDGKPIPGKAPPFGKPQGGKGPSGGPQGDAAEDGGGKGSPVSDKTDGKAIAEKFAKLESSIRDSKQPINVTVNLPKQPDVNIGPTQVHIEQPAHKPIRKTVTAQRIDGKLVGTVEETTE